MCAREVKRGSSEQMISDILNDNRGISDDDGAWYWFLHAYWVWGVLDLTRPLYVQRSINLTSIRVAEME